LVAAFVAFAALVLAAPAAATAPTMPTFFEPTADGEIVNPSDVHMEIGDFFDVDGHTHLCSDFQIQTLIGEVVWDAPCVQGLEKVHSHLGDGTFVNSLAGEHQLNFATDYKLRARFHDSAGEIGGWSERPFTTSPEGPPGVPGEIPWTVRQPGYVVEIVAGGFQLPVNIAFVPNPGAAPDSPLLYVTELWGQIKVVKRNGTISDYATNLLNFDPLGPFPGAGEQGVSGIVVEPATGDVFASMLYEDTASTDDPKPHYPKVVRFHSNDGGRTAATQTTILDMFGESQGQSHFISNTSIGPDGKLYQHMGDGYAHARAQNLNWFRGKILRMNLDGSPASDNPFYDAGDGINARDYVFAYAYNKPGSELARLTLPVQSQGESITYTRDGRALLSGSEGEHAKVWQVPLPRVALASALRAATPSPTPTEPASDSDEDALVYGGNLLALLVAGGTAFLTFVLFRRGRRQG